MRLVYDHQSGFEWINELYTMFTNFITQSINQICWKHAAHSLIHTLTQRVDCNNRSWLFKVCSCYAFCLFMLFRSTWIDSNWISMTSIYIRIEWWLNENTKKEKNKEIHWPLLSKRMEFFLSVNSIFFHARRPMTHSWRNDKYRTERNKSSNVVFVLKIEEPSAMG